MARFAPLLLTPLLAGAVFAAEPGLAGAPDGAEPSSGAVLTDHARRGMTLERLDGLAGESAAACAAVCATRPACQAWTWRIGWAGRAARCDLHGAAATPSPHPGAVTGLAPHLAARIDAAAERAPSERERRALLQAEGAIAPPAGAGLDGG
ncbi:MAG: PAN domain-containing protein [Oceanicaulis sp.]